MQNGAFPDRRRRLDKLTRNSLQVIKSNQTLIDEMLLFKSELVANQFENKEHLQYFRIRSEKIFEILQNKQIQFQQSEFTDAILLSTDTVSTSHQVVLYQSGAQITNTANLCAAPGSKTIQLADSNYNVYANELNSIRYNQLIRRINQYNKYSKKEVKLTQISNKDGIKLLEQSQIKFDCVLIDPTCSGSGNTSLDEKYAQILKIKQQLSQQELNDQLMKLSNFQKKLVSTAMKVRIPLIVYSTCSVYQQENEDVVTYLLQEHSEYQLVDALPGYQHRSTIYPASIRTGQQGNEGFYVAVFKLK